MRRVAAALVSLAIGCQPLVAAAAADPLSWLSRIASAAQELNYSGTFIYQSGPISETSRITHVIEDSVEHERLEVLDGSPRKVIRRDGEVWCVLPDRKTVITDRSTGQRSFPARLPTELARISENYEVRKEKVSRVAGFDAQLIVLEPRDDLRYGHMLWADIESGLLLKARMVGDDGETVEQFMFSDVRIGDGVVFGDTAKPDFRAGGWNVVSAQGASVAARDTGWRLATPLPGYELQSVVRRPLGRDERDVMHMVFSDGLASISVFIEPLDASAEAGLGPLASGAINIYRRSADGHLLTALGEVPARALKRLGDAMERSQ